jgi:Dioxygenase
MVVLVMDGQTTPGPFDEEESDYIDDSDLTLAARAGADGISGVDRLSVLQGIPMDLTIRVYGLDEDRTSTAATNVLAYEFPNVEVSIWHTDAAGIYSAVESFDTEGQKWLRGRQVTNRNGTVSFQTILPGFYIGRMAHYHVRLRLPGANTDYIAISQLFIADTDVDRYRTLGIYPNSLTDGAADDTITYSTNDGVYGSIDPVIAQKLTLALTGDLATSVSSSISLALITNVTGLLGTTTATTTPSPMATISPSVTMPTTATTMLPPAVSPPLVTMPVVTMPSSSSSSSSPPIPPVVSATNATMTMTTTTTQETSSGPLASSSRAACSVVAGMFTTVTTVMMITLFAGTTAVVSLLF